MSLALPEEYKIGDVVYYSGDRETLADGAVVIFGQKGKVSAAGSDIRRLKVQFDGQPRPVPIMLTWLAREDPSLGGGFKVGDRVYWQGGKQRFQSGNMLMFGIQGGLTGRGSTEKKLKVIFDGNETAMEVSIAQISVKPPQIPGGYEVGDEVYYCGEEEVFSNGDKLLNGLKGEIVGRSTMGNELDEKRVKVLFDGHSSGVIVFLVQVMKQYPKIPGGFKIGDTCYYISKKSSKFANGDKLEEGLRGKVSGRATMGDGKDDKRIKVRFEGNKGPVNVFVTEVSNEAPVPAEEVAPEEDEAAMGA